MPNCKKCSLPIFVGVPHICIPKVCKMQARIAELETENANLNDWLKTWKESFDLAQTEIAKLKATAIQWHKYPDEKPDMDVKCLVMFDDGEPIISSFDGFNWWDIGRAWVGRITHWAYLPAPPREESND